MAALAAPRRGAARLRLPRPHRAEMRAVEPGAGLAADSWRCCEGFDLGALDPVGADFVHPVIEALSSPLPTARPSTATRISSTCRWRRCSRAAYSRDAPRADRRPRRLELRPGSPDGRAPLVDRRRRRRRARAEDVAMAAGIGEPTVARLGASGGDTCHVDVIDRWGNMVSATPSGGWLQSSPAIPELGFCLGTRCQMFWLDEALPNGLEPGKRPRTTLSPALALRGRQALDGFGTPGGEQQDQWQPIMLPAHGRTTA